MGVQFTNRQKELIEMAHWLGREKFAPRAAKYDAEGSFPVENYRDMKEAGFLALCIPVHAGGLGADYETYCHVASTIGYYCGTTANTFNMHSASMLWPGRMIDDIESITPEARKQHNERREKIWADVVKNGSIFAQPFSEPNTAAATGKQPFGTTAEKVDGGWLVRGKKYFASLSGHADYYTVVCTEMRNGEELDQKHTIMMAVPAKADNFKVTGVWDTLGMRGTVSRTLEIDGAFVPDDLQMMPSGGYYQAALHWPAMFATLQPTYIGIARAAFDFTVKYLRGEWPGAKVSKRADPAKQLAVAEMRLKLEQANTLFEWLAANARYKQPKDERLRMYAAQYTVMEYSNDICRLAIRTCGGNTIQKAFPLERLYRDSRAGSLMLPWTAEICMNRLGRESLYEPGERD